MTLTFDPKTSRVPLLPKMDLWNKSEEGRPRSSKVIVWKRKGDGQTDMCKAICPLFFKGGHNLFNRFISL